MGFILVARLFGCTWLSPRRNAEHTKGNVWQCLCPCTIGQTFVCGIGVANVVRRKCVKMGGTDACIEEKSLFEQPCGVVGMLFLQFWHVLLVHATLTTSLGRANENGCKVFGKAGNVLANCCPNRVWETAIRKTRSRLSSLSFWCCLFWLVSTDRTFKNRE